MRKISPWTHVSPNSSGSLGPAKLPKIVNCATNKDTEKLKETMVGSKWNWWVATNIHLDHSSLLRKQWTPLRWVPPWDEETSAKLGPWWATFPGEGVGLLWQLDIVGSSVGKCAWSMCPWSNQLQLVPCNLDLTMLVWDVLQCRMCLVMVESMVEGGPHWTLGAGQRMGECWAQMHCLP